MLWGTGIETRVSLDHNIINLTKEPVIIVSPEVFVPLMLVALAYGSISKTVNSIVHCVMLGRHQRAALERLGFWFVFQFISLLPVSFPYFHDRVRR
jgi:elongation factor P hydroxylase